MRAALYARYSSDQQRATSIEDQFRNCRRRAEAEGGEVVATFADAAVSGTDSSRPQYLAILAAAKRREFDVLIVDDLSRFARDSLEQEKAIRRLEFDGIRIIGATDGYDSDSKARKIVRAVHGIKNELFIDELAEKVHRGQTGQALKQFWNGGRPYGYRLKPVLDPARKDAYGAAIRVGTVLAIDSSQAAVVREIFTRYVDGASCLAIARELNEGGVPSPGSTWNRKVRRCKGWMGSAIRGITRNSLYTGVQHWNRTKYLRDPDTGKDRRRARPKTEWIEHYDEALRIVSDDLFARAQSRTRAKSKGDTRLKSGGKAKFLLSGLLVCDRCSAHYVIADSRSYACSGHWNGRACSNSVRIRRDVVEKAILGPICEELLAPERVVRMANEMRATYMTLIQTAEARASSAPKELQALDERIARLRAKLSTGEEDFEADELQAAIERAEQKRLDLQNAQPAARQSAKVLSLLPRAAELYRSQISEGLSGNTRQALKARVILREMVGEIRLVPGDGGSLFASYGLQPAALLRGAGTAGRGDRI